MQSSNKQIVTNQTGAASWTSDWLPVAAAGYRNASLQVSWTAVALTAGTLSIEGSDDPSQATVTALTIATSHGTWPSVSTSAANALMVLQNCPGFVRVKYTKSAGGGANQFQVFSTVSE